MAGQTLERAKVTGIWLQAFVPGPTCAGSDRLNIWCTYPCARHAWQARYQGRDCIMDKDRIVGSAKVVKGKLKVAVGKSIGDSKLEAEGHAEKVEGKIQNAVGGVKDTIRDA
jgi:uncharacterized protein YjbJ (UPF0337 family)